MRLETTPIDGLSILHPRVFGDARGYFFESYNEEKFRKLGIEMHWAQDNHARSRKNTLRGLHFQLGNGQAKLVHCGRGRIWDVAVDIRPASPTLGRWFSLELTEENKKMLLIAEGFAHGYCVLSDEAEVLYKCSTVYDPALESEFAWNDPEIGVAWPVTEPLLSQRDLQAQSFRQYLEKLRQG
jgi:dTDP-4-dehydrorhamnose 3,5-epimerase